VYDTALHIMLFDCAFSQDIDHLAHIWKLAAERKTDKKHTPYYIDDIKHMILVPENIIKEYIEEIGKMIIRKVRDVPPIKKRK
jgi:hypothetical protein